MIDITYLKDASRDQVFAALPPQADVSHEVAAIIARVRAEGDQAVLALTQQLDGPALSALLVTPEEIAQGAAACEPAFLRVLKDAAENIRDFHRHQLKSGFLTQPRPGVTTGQKVLPLHRVGLYVPGGTASYPSSVLMNAIPAALAGVGQVVMATPPDKEGRVADAILAAASVAGVDTIYKMGGAQAVAALAYGTQSVPAVDKIVGPGNAWVAEAKRQVFGQVAIDMVAGPSEILIVADAHSDPAWVAADMLSQAEHDPLASAVLVTDNLALAQAVQGQLAAQLKTLPREPIARQSLENRGRILLVDSLDTAIEVANQLAPEHLELCLEDPFAWLGRVRNAGSVFLGRHCPETMGDYMAGPNHTLPTGGTARFSSPLSVDDFVKKIQFCHYTREALLREGPDAALFARQEGLLAHARSVTKRLEEQP